MSMSRPTNRDRSERGAERIAAAQTTLAAEIATLQSGEDWQRFLVLQARLHSYSPGNCLLIAAQHARAFADRQVDDPDPGFVGGFNLWRALGRSVNRGQHGYVVLAPCRYDRRLATDAEGNSRRLERGEPTREGERVEVRRVLAGFRAEYVFSVYQTSGAELSEPPRPQLLVGEAPVGLGAAVLEMIESQGFHVDTVADADAIAGANGVTRWDSRVVLVRADMDDAAMVKTLIHEAAHVLLHAGPPGQSLPRPLKEVEAESVAYVVASTHGMATGDYSFPYVAAWAGADGARAIQATQGRVATAARLIIEASPAPHGLGGRPPGFAEVVAAAEARRADLNNRFVADAADTSIGMVL
jgi:N-terminal domain of anti-restriction factor ArdC